MIAWRMSRLAWSTDVWLGSLSASRLVRDGASMLLMPRLLRGRWRSRHQQARVLGFGDHRAVLVHQFDRFDHDAAARRLALALADEAHADTNAVARIDRGTEADLVPAERAERGGLVELQLGLQAFDQG